MTVLATRRLALHAIVLLVAGAGLAACAATPATSAPGTTPGAGASADLARWERRAAAVTITRDDWGIAHVRGASDADAIFGMIYAQAEDDFPRVESNYLDALGRRAEAEGESAIWRDLRMKLFIDPDSLRAQYAASPAWLRALMDAWADGLNYYLHTHRDVAPRVIRRFEPWMALSFSEGSIGGDIESVSLRDLAAFYAKHATTPSSGRLDRDATAHLRDDKGSNGIAIAAQNTAAGRPLLLINPHTSFFFRSELHVASDSGLNAYGAATWGQFFLYQGFNDRLGWMHTSSGVDVIDEFLETTVEKGGRLFYKYGAEERPVAVKTIVVPYRAADGTTAQRRFTTYRTHHGPVVREEGGRWVSVALMEKPVAALSQSFLRTKARTLAEFRRAMELRANSSNNTLYADADGNVAYWHPQFIPRRDDRFDHTKPVDGSDPATDWKGEHALDESPQVLNPGNGWVFNSNNWPYTAAAEFSPKRERFPRYMDTFGENARGQHAIRVLTGKKDFTPASLEAAAYDSYLPGFATLVPVVVKAWDALPAGDARRARLAEPVATLRAWDFRWDTASVATSLAVFWGTALRPTIDARGLPPRRPSETDQEWVAAHATGEQALLALDSAVARLARDFGRWRTPWGEINRFQRLTADIVHPFDDAKASIPVGFTHGIWGSLASFAAAPRGATKKWYGTSGNSFVAIVEFGRDSVRARAVTAGGESGHPESPHFNDQAQRYATGRLREVYFYPGQLAGHTRRTYRPGR
jgi:acyl-homoserine-lactone acylase